MRFPFLKPIHFSTYSLEMKVDFIKTCCEERIALWNKLHPGFFGRTPSTYLQTVKAIKIYMEGYLNRNLDTPLKNAITQYAIFCNYDPDDDIPVLETCRQNPLNDDDIDLAFLLINQLFLSNLQFYNNFTTSIRDHKSSPGFRVYLNSTLINERREWATYFPGNSTYDDMLCEKTRYVIKAFCIASCCLSLGLGGIGSIFLATLMLSALLYPLSGELGDHFGFNVNTELRPRLLGPG